MGSNLFIILLLVSAVWQIVGSIAEKKAKQKQQEELARRRTEAQGSGRVATATAESGETTRLQSPGGVDARSRAEQIAARRKAQIDELRRRAAERAQGGRPTPTAAPGAPAGSGARPGGGGGGGGRTIMADTGRSSSRAGGGSSQPTGSRRPEIARDWDELTRRREAERTAKTEGRRQQDLRDAAERRRKDASQQARRSREASEEATATAERTARTRGGIAAAGFGSTSGSRSRRLSALVRNREAMRDAIMLQELLAPPMALRSLIVPADANRDR